MSVNPRRIVLRDHIQVAAHKDNQQRHENHVRDCSLPIGQGSVHPFRVARADAFANHASQVTIARPFTTAGFTETSRERITLGNPHFHVRFLKPR